MIAIYSIIMGIFIVLISLLLIRKEFKNSFFVSKKKEYGDDLDGSLKNLEELINSMNESFYDLIGDVEGNTSLNVFEIENNKNKLEFLEKEIISLKKQLIEINNKIIFLDENEEKETIKNLKFTVEENEIGKVPLRKEIIEEETIEKDKIEDKIIILRSKGMNVSQIAKELGIGIGEIQLILNMKK